MTEYFEFEQQNVSCFWEITLTDNVIKIRCGEAGTKGDVTETVFHDRVETMKEYNRLVKEKKQDETYYFRLGDYRL